MASIVKNGSFQGEEGYNCPGEWESSPVYTGLGGTVISTVVGWGACPRTIGVSQYIALQPYNDRTCAFVRQNLSLRKGQPYKLTFYASSRVDAPKGTLMVCIDSKILFEKELSHDWVKYSVNFTATSISSLLTFYNYGLHPNNDNIQDGKTEAYWYATSISSVEVVELPNLFGNEDGGFNLSLPPIKALTESDDKELELTKDIIIDVKNIESIDIKEDSDIGYGVEVMDKSYTWQEVIDECYKMDKKPNVIVKNGKGKYYIKCVPIDKYDKIRYNPRRTMVIINWK